MMQERLIFRPPDRHVAYTVSHDVHNQPTTTAVMQNIIKLVFVAVAGGKKCCVDVSVISPDETTIDLDFLPTVPVEIVRIGRRHEA